MPRKMTNILYLILRPLFSSSYTNYQNISVLKYNKLRTNLFYDVRFIMDATL